MSDDSFFLDTNILVYAYSLDEPEKRKIAQRLMDSPNAVLSTQVLNEFIWVMNKKAGIGIPQIFEIVQSLIDTTRVQDTDTELILDALDISRETGYSHWDALILAASIRCFCSVIYSEDLQDGRKIGTCRIQNPFR